MYSAVLQNVARDFSTSIACNGGGDGVPLKSCVRVVRRVSECCGLICVRMRARVRVCACVYICVLERERQREREIAREREYGSQYTKLTEADVTNSNLLASQKTYLYGSHF